MAAKPRSVRHEIKQSKPFPSLAVEAVVALFRTADGVRGRITEALHGYGVSPQQYNVLRILRGAQGALPTLEIAARMIERSPGITRLLDRLEDKGLVRRERCRPDRRQVLCSITDAGLQLLDGLDGPVIELDEDLMAALDANEQRQLIDLLDRVRAANRG